VKINITFQLDAREARELRRAARGVAIATVSRALTLRFFGVKATRRIGSGPGAKMAPTLALMRRRRVA